MPSYKKISLVIPSYNVEKTVQRNLVNIIKVLEGITSSYEIVYVNDGSIDETRAELTGLTKKYPNVKLISYPNNMGKGHALRKGFAEASGKIIGFIDADGDINPKSIKVLYNKFVTMKADIVVGSKNIKGSSVEVATYRKLISSLSQKLIKKLFNMNFSDTQAGIKMFRQDLIKKINSQLSVNGFAIDIEILILAKKSGYKRFYEAPIIVNINRYKKMGSTDYLRFLKELFITFKDILIIYMKYR